MGIFENGITIDILSAYYAKYEYKKAAAGTPSIEM